MDFLPQRVGGYDSFKFIGANTFYFLGFYVDSAELLFNGDFLTAVILTFRKEEKCSSETLNQRLSSIGYVYSESILGFDVFFFVSNNKISNPIMLVKTVLRKWFMVKEDLLKSTCLL